MTRLRRGYRATDGLGELLESWRSVKFDPEKCPVRSLLAQLGDKWTILVLVILSQGARRFSEICREIPDISKRVLTGALRDLERNGLVARRVFPTNPPSVEYRLTDLGGSLLEPLVGLVVWANENLRTVEAARSQFDKARSAAEVVRRGL